VKWPDPGALLHALRYLDPRMHALARLRAACLLAKRLDILGSGAAHLPDLVYAVNLLVSPEAEAAWAVLTEPEQPTLTDAANRLFADNEQRHLALCAMRTVGGSQSLELIAQSVGDPREGTVPYGVAGTTEPAWESIRPEAREAISHRSK